ncbi:MAG TPA: hypothetical protein VHK27_12290 [Gammaproteobacteria bacterium]|nr:hypothetical protein [Gammaproteobacteria bacterium]
MKSTAVIRHVAFEDQDAFAQPLVEHGFRIRYLQAGVDDLARIDPLKPAFLAIWAGLSARATRRIIRFCPMSCVC